ncbi:MAG: DUF1002 domain-containing protein [Christensenellaceae bacterium]|nr:DUF1002 domain-containing protein [Christensenellaceae bacterium]
MKKSLIRRLSVLFMAAVITVMSLVPVFAVEEGEKRAVIGADLSEDKVDKIYQDFGIGKGDVKEITVTNKNEREYLEGLVSEDKIGNVALSCVYIETMKPGYGLDIKINNIKWCTEAMYKSALLTAGITDAKVIISAPHPVTGTAALTGIYLAYEDITGESLDRNAKEVAVEELVTTGELGDLIGSEQAVEIINSLKEILDETAKMSDEDVKSEIKRIAEEYNVELTDSQVDRILKLVRSLEGLDVNELQDRLKGYADTMKTVKSVGSFFEQLGEKIVNFFNKVGDFFSKLFGGKKTEGSKT